MRIFAINADDEKYDISSPDSSTSVSVTSLVILTTKYPVIPAATRSILFA